MEISKALIIGVDSLAGCNLAHSWADRCDVIGTCDMRNFAANGFRIVPISPFSDTDLSQILAGEQPQRIVYCGPTSRSAWDWQDFDVDSEAQRLAVVCRAAKRAGIPVSFVSTDAVFTGPRLFCDEDAAISEKSPIAVAVRKLEAIATDAEALIVRTHLYGQSPTGDSCVEQIWSALADGRPITASGNHYATPISASDFSELLWKAQCQDLSGIYHLAGAERTSLWQFASELALACGMPLKIIQSKSNSSTSGISFQDADEGQESSLDSRRLQRQLKTPLPMLREGIQRFIEQSENEHSNLVIGSTSSAHQPLAA